MFLEVDINKVFNYIEYMIKKVKVTGGVSVSSGKKWFEQFEEEDLAFIKRFVLASGSLKEMAKQYGVSYPTVRRRLDRMIAKMAVLDSLRDESPFERTLRLLAVDGKIDAVTLKTLLAAYTQDRKEKIS